MGDDNIITDCFVNSLDSATLLAKSLAAIVDNERRIIIFLK